ncbi:DUF1376 domain-containing protein [Ralstonia solanacearum]|uniref:DUF1376 domain-containing protein n=1 Tax=Ralstonia solanacearum TaxID=305 RepID=UPI00168B7AB1|nr:DUF1376 domain-containing protein [Ralstonia solanacearum]QNT25569.1 DUF1376 domain-containing protein [Ralstonia solanacearum]QNT25856.1 DUF1376 domain-containing protein [Ralstonia solanacearum]QNT63210.1 DUF1376 domain-containing protein [Ralstonia solanacearum]
MTRTMKLPFQQVDVGEWFERTAHLSIMEIGILSYLENSYWRTGELPPREAIERAIRMRDGDPAVLDSILAQYFPDGRSSYLDAQRTTAIDLSQRRSSNAKRQHADKRDTTPPPESGSNRDF